MNLREARALAERLSSRGILTVEPYTGSGAGGQHRNRTRSGIRLIGRWTLNGRPLELRAQACMKSQHASLRAALLVLLGRFHAAIEEERSGPRERTAGFGPQGRVRTYHEPDDRVVDESGPRFSYRETVGKGSLSALISARRRALASLP